MQQIAQNIIIYVFYTFKNKKNDENRSYSILESDFFLKSALTSKYFLTYEGYTTRIRVSEKISRFVAINRLIQFIQVEALITNEIL